MKTDIHPTLFDTKVHCNGCDTNFTTRATVPEITVEICSNCHPFYTGKQKLVDTAGRVEKFEARRKAAEAKKAASLKAADVKAEREAKKAQKNDPELKEIAEELKDQTIDEPAEVDAPAPEAETEKTDSTES
ncbi:50S ribosomal protein L31 [Patescibacteria group bacterium]|nr:MAG: 50S ribosomal protein L31 [Patescibacteria group bacterium]